MSPLVIIKTGSVVQGYVEHYNNTRLNSAIGYVTPKDMLAGAAHRPAKAVFPVGCTRSLATCASARSSRSIGDSRAKFGHASCQRFE